MGRVRLTARGKFITLEGGEGTGKSTQIALLKAWLETTGLDVLVTREPGGAPGAESIRSLLVEGEVLRWEAMTEALLHYAARTEHLAKTVFPALDAARWVLSDRFSDSTLAYQGYGHGLDHSAIKRLHEIAVGSFEPDLTIVLDLPVEKGLARAKARSGNEDRYERMDISFHHRLREGFLEIAEKDQNRCVVVDAQGAVETVQELIKKQVSQRLSVS
jgi:dTMP kinase